MKKQNLHLIIGIVVVLSFMAYNFFFSDRLNADDFNCNTATNINVLSLECNALVSLYTETNGDNRTTSTNWNTNTDVCTWHGISCIDVEGQEHVVAINLPNNNLAGILPAALSSLRNIELINFQRNRISANLPAAWQAMTTLKSLDLSVNSLEGSLPSNWSSLRFLETFSVGSNELIGTLPATRSAMTRLREFDISNNSIGGELPSERSELGSMIIFNASGNNLYGTLPAAWGSSRPSANSVILNNNFLYGAIPDSRTDMRDLNENTGLQLAHNCFIEELTEGPNELIVEIAGTEWQYSQTHCMGDLSIAKSVNLNYAEAGREVIYTLAYSNNSIHPISGVTVTDILPSDLSYVSSSTLSGIVVSGSSISRHIGIVQGNFSGVLNLTAQVRSNATSGININNTASISGYLIDIDSATNVSNTVSITALGRMQPATPMFAGGGSARVKKEAITQTETSTKTPERIINTPNTGTVDIIPFVPNSRVTEEISPISASGATDSTGTIATSIPTEKKNLCPYTDTDPLLQKNTFIDVQGTIYAQAVDTMLEHCLIKGYYNERRIFGTYNMTKRGEAYKIYARLAKLSLIEPITVSHRSDIYKEAGEKADLWKGISAKNPDPETPITYGDIYTIGSNLLKYSGKQPLPVSIETNAGKNVSRGLFALFLQKIIEKISE